MVALLNIKNPVTPSGMLSFGINVNMQTHYNISVRPLLFRVTASA